MQSKGENSVEVSGILSNGWRWIRETQEEGLEGSLRGYKYQAHLTVIFGPIFMF